jgi:UDP:flavonoid glycosyltransferase YjiC (YdhE family)
VVTHAGLGTVMIALYHGVPLVCLPMGRDQPDNAARVEVRGLGLSLSPTANERALQRAIRTVLSDPSFRERARALSTRLVEEVAADRAVAELEQLAGLPPR